MAQKLVVGATQLPVQFPGGTQEIGFHRFTDQVGTGGPVITHLEPVDFTAFGPFTTAATHTLTYATIGTDGMTVLGPVISKEQSLGAQVTLLVAAGITVQVIQAEA